MRTAPVTNPTRRNWSLVNSPASFAQNGLHAGRWTVIGLAIAFFSMPLVLGLFSSTHIPWTVRNVVLRELSIWAFAALLMFIVRRKERLGWESVGLQRPAIGNTALWVLITMVGAALSIAIAFAFIRLLNLPIGSSDSAKYEVLPTWVLAMTIVRAGFVEEFFYRGYAIERLHLLTHNRFWSAAVALLFFSVFHYRQGWAGIIIALLTGAVLTYVYSTRRNLWVTIIAHFLADFIPNIVVPLFTSN